MTPERTKKRLKIKSEKRCENKKAKKKEKKTQNKKYKKYNHPKSTYTSATDLELEREEKKSKVVLMYVCLKGK